MAHDTRTFVAICPVCRRGKSSYQPTAVLLQPQTIPQRPWSHIALDFITRLPPSEGNMVIMTVVNRFSKTVHFVPLPGNSSAADTGRLMVKHVFLLHGIPRDIVSDRGLQFTSRVRKAFCLALGAKVSLYSGYHPQSNGEDEPNFGRHPPVRGRASPGCIMRTPSVGEVRPDISGLHSNRRLPLPGNLRRSLRGR